MYLLVYNSVFTVVKMMLLRKIFDTWILLYVITAGLRQASADMHNIIQGQATNVQLAKYGFPAEFTCSFAFPESGYLVSWNKNGVNLVMHDPEISLTRSSDGRMYNINKQEKTASLRLKDVSFDDAGQYSCRTVFTVYGKPEARFWKLVVQDGPILKSISSVMENQTLLAECCVTFTDSRIQVKYLWSIDVPLATTYRSNVTENPICSNISFTARRKHHNKLLVCTIENELNLSIQERIDVTFPATVVMFSKQTYDNKGYHVVIECATYGYPIPDVYLQNKVLDKWETVIDVPPTLDSIANERRQVTWKFYVSIENSKQVEAYRCRANNTILYFDDSNVVIIKSKLPFDVFLVENIQAIICVFVASVIIVVLLVALRYHQKKVSRNILPVVTRFIRLVRNSMHLPINFHRASNNQAPTLPDTRNIPGFSGNIPRDQSLDPFEKLPNNDVYGRAERTLELDLHNGGASYATVQKKSCETITAGLNESNQEEEEDYIGILAEQQTTQI